VGLFPAEEPSGEPNGMGAGVFRTLERAIRRATAGSCSFGLFAVAGLGACCLTPANEGLQQQTSQAGNNDAGISQGTTTGGSGGPAGSGGSGDCTPDAGTGQDCVINGTPYVRGSSRPGDPSMCCSPALNSNEWVYRLQDGGTFDTGSWPSAIEAADFNNDGRMDLVIAAGGVGTGDQVVVLLGQQGGGFGPSVTYHVCADPAIGAGDLNGDGFVDIALADCGALMNRGDGTFVFLPSQGPLSELTAAETGFFPLVDLDGDQILDAVLVGRGAFFLKGIGDGTFAPPTQILRNPVAPAVFSYASAVGDFRTLGRPDVVTANLDSLAVLFGDGRGAFSVGWDIRVELPQSVAVGDFDGDGHLDLASAGFDDPLIIALGRGDGTFTAPTSYPSVGVGSVTFADLLGDGRAEAIVANWYGGDTFTVLWHLCGNDVLPTQLPAGKVPTCVLAADLNADGRPDLAICNGQSNTINLYINSCP